MHVIKKYANRKLYHTNQKQYITLEGIARLVQEGEPIQVFDNETGGEITPVILAQVILQARGRSGSPQLPTSVLTSLIQLGGDTLAGLRKTIFNSLGGVELIEAEIGRRIDRLIDEGSLSKTEGYRWRQLLLRQDLTDSMGVPVDLPSGADVAELHRQVDALTAVVERLIDTRSKAT